MDIFFGIIGLFAFPIALIVFLVALFKKNKSLKKKSLIAMGIAFASFVLGLSLPKSSSDNKATENLKTSQTTSSKKEAEAKAKKEAEAKAKKEAEAKAKKEAEAKAKKEAEAKAKKEAEAKAAEEISYDPNVDYNAWNHDQLDMYKTIQITGEVVQNTPGKDGQYLRVALNGDYDSMVLVGIPNSYYKKNILAENDNVTINGVAMGVTTYESTMGGEITIPMMMADNYVINSYGQ